MQIEKVYEPQRFEPHWAEWWIEKNVFRADANEPGPRFSMVIPPPNVTGALHIGHMLDHTIMDAATRWHRMRGDNTLWLPGTDHAGISTQVMVERLLAKQGVKRADLGREEFEKRVWQWREQYGGRILAQMKQIGDSVDWSRVRFTLDPDLSRAVIEAFVRLYERGLIYRGAYMINWCPECHTALSDLEVIHEEVQGHMWHIRYPVDDSTESLVVATTRPETMLGDTAVAVNPKDERYKHLAGKTVLLPLMNRHIPIIFDDLAQPEFGTGVVKVTPAHDPNDLEAGKRHNLPHVQVIDYDARMTEAAGPYAGLDRFEARKRIVEDLEKQGYLVKVEPHTLSIGTCQRSKTIVEPLISTQWFMRMKPLAEKAKAAVEDGRIQFIPENWNKTYFNWMDNIRDWCISRQLWWGHRIPAWHCAECGQTTVARTAPQTCSHCGSTRLEQDADVLDTWFSSGLWPFSTLGWPEETQDLKTYYPTSLLITGFDILFFWVARMIMMGIELTDQVPFRQVHMHGLVRDADKQKISKTKGNVIDPLEITEKYGTDAFRMALIISAGAGSDIVYSEERVLSARAFANKIWNSANLVLGQEAGPVSDAVHLEDRWMWSRAARAADQANRAFEQHRYHEAAHTLWHSFWGEYCDWYLEIKKLTPDVSQRLPVFETYLRLLHPVMPFITEELWHRLGHEDSIALARYPGAEGIDEAAERDMALLQEMITVARAVRADYNVENKMILQGVLYCRGGAQLIAERYIGVIEKFANLRLEVRKGSPTDREGVLREKQDFDLQLEIPRPSFPFSVSGTLTYTPPPRARFEKEIQQYTKLIADKDRQLGNETFLKNAPTHIVEGLRQKRAEYQAQLEKSRVALDQLQ